MLKKLFLMITMLVCFISSFLNTSLNSSYSNKETNRTKNVIIQYKQNTRDITLTTQRLIQEKEVNKDKIYSAQINEAELEILKKDTNIKRIEEDGIVRKSNDTINWNISKVNASELHFEGKTGEGIKVAILDTGIDLNNNELNVAGGVSFVDGVTSYNDDNGHGTSVAGIIGALKNGQGILGVAPDVELYSVKVLDRNGYGRYSNVIKGIEWAVENEIDVVVMAFGGTQYSKILEEVVDRAFSEGVLLLGSAGNGGNEASIEFPARYYNVISVGAIDINNKLAEFSNTGPGLNLVAPGVNIQTTHLNNRLANVDGTSASVAHVAGVAAQIWSANKDLSNSQVMNLLNNTAIYLGDKNKYGNGLVSGRYANSKINDGAALFTRKDKPIKITEQSVEDGEITPSYIHPDYTFFDNQTIFVGQSVSVRAWFHSPHDKVEVTAYRESDPNNILFKESHPKTAGNGAFLTETIPGSAFTTPGTYKVRYHSTTNPECGIFDDYFTVNVVERPNVKILSPKHRTTLTEGSNTVKAESWHSAGVFEKMEIHTVYEDIFNNRFEFIMGGSTSGETTPTYVSNERTRYFGVGTYELTARVIVGHRADISDSTSPVVKDNYEESSTVIVNVTKQETSTPEANSVRESNIGINSATISWQTNVNTRYAFTYGKLENNLDKLKLDNTFNTSHQVNLTNLEPGTTYYYKIHSYNTSEQLTESSLYAFTTDTPRITGAPEIVNKTRNSVTIRWNTNFDCLGIIEYGTTQSKGTTVTGSPNRKNHQITINNLQEGTLYYFAIKGEAGKVYDLGEDFWFATKDRYEDNNTIATATPINMRNTYFANIDNVYDVDFYRLNVSERGNLYINVNNIPEGSMYRIAVLNSSGNLLAYYDTFIGQRNTGLGYNLPAGTYYVGIEALTHECIPYNKYSLSIDFHVPRFLVSQRHYGESGTNSATGNFSRSYTDFELDSPGYPLNIERTYNSMDLRESTLLGKGWSFGFEGKVNQLTKKEVWSDGEIVEFSDPNLLEVKLPNGRVNIFQKLSNGTFVAKDSRNQLVQAEDKTYTLTTKEQTQYGFNSKGYLIWIQDRHGNRVTINVDDNGRILNVSDPTGRTLTLNYTSSGRISTIHDSVIKRNIVTYEYNSDNNLQKVTNLNGTSTWYFYDSDGNLNKIEDHNRALVESVEYYTSGNDKGKVKKHNDRLGGSYTYQYEDSNNRTTISDNNNTSRQRIEEYDSLRYIVSTTTKDGSTSYTESIELNEFGERKSFTDKNGNRTIYTLDSRGNVTRITNPDNSYKEFAYDSKNNIIRERNEEGILTFYVYDSTQTKLIKKVQPLNGTDNYVDGQTNTRRFAVTEYRYYSNSEAKELGYTVKGLLKSVKDPEERVVTYTYYSDGLIKEKIEPNNEITRYKHNNLRLVEEIRSPKGNKTEFIYNNQGDLLKTTQSNSNGTESSVTRIVRDALGRRIQEISPVLYNSSRDNISSDRYNGNEGYRYTYSETTGLLTSVRDPEGHTTTYKHDIYGRASEEIKPNGAIYKYDYDVLGRIIKLSFKERESDSYQVLEEYRYEILSDKTTRKRVTRYLDNSGKTATTTYIYDYANRLLTQQNPDGTSTANTYYNDGALKTQRDGNQNVTHYRYNVYDSSRNVKFDEVWKPLETINGTTYYTYARVEYNKSGQKIQERVGKQKVTLNQVPSSFVTTNYSYDSNGRVRMITDSSGKKVVYEYDLDGNIEKEEVFTKSNESIVTTYVNNYLGKPTEKVVIARKGDIYGNDFGDNSEIAIKTEYTYYKDGTLRTVKEPNGVITTYEYDQMGRQTKVSKPGVDENGKNVTVTVSKTYNWEGKVASETDGNNNTTHYEYNKRGFLEKIIQKVTVNRVSTQRITYYEYDRAGRRIVEIQPENYDSTKSTNQMNRTVFAYDDMGRLKTKEYFGEEKTFNPTSNTWTSTNVNYVQKAYKYDANGNLIKELDALGYAAGSGSTVEARINSGYGTEYRYNSANKLIRTTTPENPNNSKEFTYDALGRKVSEKDENGVIRTFNYDDAGNVTTIRIRRTSSSPQQTIETNTYDLAGNLLTTTDGNGNKITYEYNKFNKISKVIYPGDSSIPSNTVIYQYDIVGNLKMQQQSDGTTDIFSYDNFGRNSEHTRQDGNGNNAIPTSTRYDRNGNVILEIDGNGNRKEYKYDELNRVISEKLSQNHITTYTYDKNDNLIRET